MVDRQASFGKRKQRISMQDEARSSPRKVERKLVTIFASDFVSYSAHVGHDEEGTARVLKAHRSVIDGIIAFHDGRIFDTAGDSVLAEFASPVQAVRAAIEIQEALQTRNESLPEASRMVLRIGINLGDVLVQGDKFMGDAINVAARLESLARPGGIVVSGAIHDQVAGKLDWGFSDLGTPPLKNISRPIRVLEVLRTPGRSVVTPPRPASRRGAIAAVLAILVAVTVGGAGVWWSTRTSPPPASGTSAAPVAAPAAAAAPAPPAAYLTQEPEMGKLGDGVRVLVDDRTCPDGQIKEVIGGNFYWPDGTRKKEGVARTRRCIPR